MPATRPLSARTDMRFSALLEARLARSGRRRKGLRRKIALRIAAARLFEQQGYDASGAAEIAEAAGLSRAGFYVYFRDKAHVAVSVLRPFVAVAFPVEGAQSGAAVASLEQLYRMINDNRRLVQCLEALRTEAPSFVSAVDVRVLRWHGEFLDAAGLDPRLASLLSAMSMGLAWRPSADLDGGVARVTELLSPQLSHRGEAQECPGPWRGPGGAVPRVLVQALP